MLYFILRPLTRIALRAYFRRITINGLSNLPVDKPVLLCSNHPTGFIEPCLLACFLPRTLHFLVRGDLFEKPVLKKILVSTNQIPIYRFRDGYEKLRNNKEVMNISYDKLAQGEAILIFPEASTQQVKYLRDVKKGAARMALETLKLHPDIELSIVPIGINYSSPNTWRSYVNINIGEPITPSLPEDDVMFRKESLRLTRLLEERLSSELLVLNEGVSEEELDKVLVLGQWEKGVNSSFNVRKDEREKFEQEREISVALTSEKELNHLEIPNSEVNPGERNRVVDYVLSIIIFIPVIVLLLVNALPVFVGMLIRNKYVKEREFYASVAIAASLGAYMILFVIALVIFLLIFGPPAFLLLMLPVGGLLGLIGMDYLRKVYRRMKLRAKLGDDKSLEIYHDGLETLNRIRS